MTVSVEGDFGKEMLLRLNELEEKSNIKLKKSHKILLAETGTVEQVLSILLDSPVSVEVKSQIVKGYTIEREVVLGAKDATLIYAKTQIDVRALPSGVVADIKEGKLGIGTIINRHKLETYRRVIEMGYNQNRNVVYRVYEILYGAEPKFRIREEFNIEKIG